MSEKRELQRGDVVKLGPTAQELHDVLYLVAQIGVRIRQRSTGKERTVDRGRCIVVLAADDPFRGGHPNDTRG